MRRSNCLVLFLSWTLCFFQFMSGDARSQERAAMWLQQNRPTFPPTFVFFVHNQTGEPLYRATVTIDSLYVEESNRMGVVRFAPLDVRFPLRLEVSAPGYQSASILLQRWELDIPDIRLSPLQSKTPQSGSTVTLGELSPDVQASATKSQEEAVKALQRGDNSRAQELLLTALQLSPSSAAAYNNLGVALLRQGKVDQASVFFEKASELAPFDAAASGNLGLMRWLQGRYDESYRFLDRAVSLGFPSPTARYYLGILALQRGHFEQAIQVLSRLKPERFVYRDLYLSLSLRGLGSEPEASRAFQRFLRRNPVQLYASDHTRSP